MNTQISMPISPLTGADFENQFGDLFSALPSGAAITTEVDTSAYPHISQMFEHLKKTDTIIGIDFQANQGRVVIEEMKDYLCDTSYSSGDIAKAVAGTPYEVWFDKNNPEEEAPKKHFEFGSFAHRAVLEPHTLDQVVTMPSFGGNSKAGVLDHISFLNQVAIEWNISPSYCDDTWKMEDLKRERDLLIQNLPVTFIDEGWAVAINTFRKKIETYGNGILKRLLSGAWVEQSFYTNLNGMNVKARPDAINFAENVGLDCIISVKTTRTADIRSFMSNAASLRYNLKESFYQMVVSQVTGREFRTTLMVVLQSVEPYDIALIWLQPEDMERGRTLAIKGIDIINQCESTGNWPGLEQDSDNEFGIISASFPSWAF